MVTARDDVHQWAMRLVLATARRSTCLLRQNGCVLLDAGGYVLATGYNGAAAGQPHCTDLGCNRKNKQSGTGHEDCRAIHAEQNALLRCMDITKLHAAYVTLSPCVTCTRLFLNTPTKVIYFIHEYPQPFARELWRNAERQHIQMEVTGSDGTVIRRVSDPKTL